MTWTFLLALTRQSQRSIAWIGGMRDNIDGLYRWTNGSLIDQNLLINTSTALFNETWTIQNQCLAILGYNLSYILNMNCTDQFNAWCMYDIH